MQWWNLNSRRRGEIEWSRLSYLPDKVHLQYHFENLTHQKLERWKEFHKPLAKRAFSPSRAKNDDLEGEPCYKRKTVVRRVS